MPTRRRLRRRLGPVLVGGLWYERQAANGPGGPEGIVIPGVPSGQGRNLDAVPERILWFRGYAPTISIQVRQLNRVVTDEDGREVVAGLTGWSVAFNEITVYSATSPTSTALEALMRAGAATQELLAHPVDWCIPERWRDRPIWYYGVPSHIRAYDPLRGLVVVETATSPSASYEVDILSDAVAWQRSEEPDGSEPAAPVDGGDADGPALVPGGPGDAEPAVRSPDPV